MAAKRRTAHYGWLPDLPDVRDLLFVAAPEVISALPPSVDLRPQCPPVYDQGQLGSCTANAIAGAFEFDQLKQGETGYVPSRLFIYYEERDIEGTIGSDAGAMIRDGVKVVHKLGAPNEIDWPYDISRFSQKPPTQAYTDGLAHKVLTYHRIGHNLQAMKACLVAGYPFVFGFTVYDSFESQQVASTGIMPMPAKGEGILGGHAVTAVGYDDTLDGGGFWVRNSWGPGWGAQGYFFMPYPFISNRGYTSDFWTLRTVA